MVTVYAVPSTSTFPNGVMLIDGYGSSVTGAEGVTFIDRATAEAWAFENGYHISKRPYAPAEVVG